MSIVMLTESRATEDKAHRVLLICPESVRQITPQIHKYTHFTDKGMYYTQ